MLLWVELVYTVSTFIFTEDDNGDGEIIGMVGRRDEEDDDIGRIGGFTVIGEGVGVGEWLGEILERLTRIMCISRESLGMQPKRSSLYPGTSSSIKTSNLGYR